MPRYASDPALPDSPMSQGQTFPYHPGFSFNSSLAAMPRQPNPLAAPPGIHPKATASGAQQALQEKLAVDARLCALPETTRVFYALDPETEGDVAPGSDGWSAKFAGVAPVPGLPPKADMSIKGQQTFGPKASIGAGPVKTTQTNSTQANFAPVKLAGIYRYVNLVSKAAGQADTDGPMQHSAVGESKGLTFTDAGPQTYGREAWGGVSGYLHHGRSIKRQPNPFTGEHKSASAGEVDPSCPKCPHCGSDETYHTRSLGSNAKCYACEKTFTDPGYGKSAALIKSAVPWDKIWQGTKALGGKIMPSFMTGATAKAIAPHVAPTIMGGAGGYFASEPQGINPLAGAAAGALAMNPRLQRWAGPKAAPLFRAAQGNMFGADAGMVGDQALSAYGVDTNNALARLGGGIGGLAGGVSGSVRQVGQRLAGPALAGGGGAPAAGAAVSAAGKGMGRFAQSLPDFSLGAAKAIPSALERAGRGVVNFARPGTVASKAWSGPTGVMQRLGAGTAGLGLAGGAVGLGMQGISNAVDDKAQKLYGGAMQGLHEYLGKAGPAHLQNAISASVGNVGSGLGHVADQILRSIGMNPEGMHPAQKAMILGGGAAGIGGLATGHPLLAAGGGLAAAGGAYGAMGGQMPWSPNFGQHGPPTNAPTVPGARNELAVQTQAARDQLAARA